MADRPGCPHGRRAGSHRSRIVPLRPPLHGRRHDRHGVRLLAPESIAAMQTPRVSASGIQHVGLSSFITDLDGTRMISHGGGTHGQVTHLAIVPNVSSPS